MYVDTSPDVAVPQVMAFIIWDRDLDPHRRLTHYRVSSGKNLFKAFAVSLHGPLQRDCHLVISEHTPSLRKTSFDEEKRLRNINLSQRRSWKKQNIDVADFKSKSRKSFSIDHLLNE